METIEQVKDALDGYGLDYSSIGEDGNVIEVYFPQQDTDILSERLEAAGVRRYSVQPRKRGSYVVVQIWKSSTTTPTLSEAFAAVAKSTTAFHERFETRKHSTLQDARVVMDEEYREVQHEISNIRLLDIDRRAELAKEMVDLWVTGLGALLFAEVDEQLLIEALLEVAAKNDRKTLDNCVWHNGKVTRKEKLEQGNG